jgi:hypothetical protein
MRTSLIVVVAIVAFLVWVLRPVCVPLSEEELSGFNVPIEQRTDRDFYFKVFQQKESQWYQCKTWLSRQFFF